MGRRLPLLVSVIALVMGFLITQQIRTVAWLNHTAQVQDGRTLEYLVANALQYDAHAGQKVRTLEQKIAAVGAAGHLMPLKRQLNRIHQVAGLTAIKGSGVTVVIHDAAAPAFPGEPSLLELVHDQYVLRVVALLSSAGAQAIAINGQRYVAVTSIFCAGPTIRINNVPYASPYVIEAIGPVQPMLKAVSSDPDIEGWAQLVSIQWHAAPYLEIAPYRASLHFFAIKPVKIGR